MSVGLQGRWERLWPLYSQARKCHNYFVIPNGDEQSLEPPSPPLARQHDLTGYGSLSHFCLRANILLEIQIAHDHILRNGLERSKPFSSLLLSNYNKFGAVSESLSLFKSSQDCILDDWNSFITVFSCTGMRSEVFYMFNRMQLEGLLPDKVTYMQVISICARYADIAEGKRSHARIRLGTFDADIYLGTTIISMYDKCRSLSDANRKWREMLTESDVSWTAIISCHVHHGQHKEAIQLFFDMLEQGVKPNKVTFVCILDMFARPSQLGVGQVLHHFIIESGYGSDMKVGVPLVCMYKNCGSAADGTFVFQNMSDRDLDAWNAIISMYQTDLDYHKVLEIFNQLQNEGFQANYITFVCMLGAHYSPEAVIEAKRIHIRVLHSGFEANVKVGTALINLYGRCGHMELIEHLLANMKKRDVVLWTSLIDLYNQHEHAHKAIECFYRMLKDGVDPSVVTFVCILDAYRNSSELGQGRCMHAFIIEKGFEADKLVGNTILAFYGYFGCLQDARSVLNKLPERSVVSWTALMAVYAHHGLSHESLELFNSLLLEGLHPNLVTFLSILDACAREAKLEAGQLVHTCAVENGLQAEDSLVTALACMYSKSGSLEDSKALINSMDEDKDSLWNAKILLHAQQGLYECSVELFGQKESRGFQASTASYACVLDVCASCATLEDGKLIHYSAICDKCDRNAMVANALLNMYGRCGDLEACWRTFDTMSYKGVIEWSAMIALSGQHGFGKKALELFECMLSEDVMPNMVTFSAVLEACNHTGLLHEASACFMALVKEHARLLAVEMYVPIVDLLGRTGGLDIAQLLISNMPCQPAAPPYTVMLGACRHDADVERAIHIAKSALELDPDNEASYISLSNIFTIGTLAYTGAHIG